MELAGPDVLLGHYAAVSGKIRSISVVARNVLAVLQNQDLVHQVPRRGISVDHDTLINDLEAEGEPEKEFNPGIAGRLPRKSVAAGALIRDEADRILFVVPTYKPTLDIPGGIVEDNESPRAACAREVSEELGLSIPLGSLLVIDWTPTHGVWHDGLQFIYDGGILASDDIARTSLDTTELSAVRFLHLDGAQPRLRPSMARRLAVALTALRDGNTVYAEFGHPGQGVAIRSTS